MTTPFTPGALLGGRYALERRVGDDGLTERWAATDRVLARGVTVEGLSPNALPGAREAFLAAVAGAARLVHPGIVATYDSGVAPPPPDPGLPYVVTERPRGATLAAVVQRHGPLSAARVVTIGRQLAQALAAAHRAGVSHGDVTAETILFGEDDRVKLARFVSSGAQVRLRASSGGDDVAGLAAALADALVGEPLARPVSPRAHRAGVPPALDAVLVGGQTGAYGDADDFAAALGALDIADDAEPTVTREITPPMGTPALARPAARAGSRSGTIGGIVVGLVLLVAVAVAAFVLSGGGGGSLQSTAGGTTAPGGGRAGGIAITAAHSFNPQSPDDPTKHENEALAAKLFDGDPATTWSTLQYTTRSFGNLKKGTGAYIELEGSHTLRQLTVTSPTRGWTFSVYVAGQAGTDLAGWGAPVAGPTSVTADVTQVDLHSAKGGAVLVWITQLGDTAPYHAEIGELAVR